MAQVKEFLTFDDVLLKPRVSDVLPNDVDISTKILSLFRLKMMRLVFFLLQGIIKLK